MRRLGWPLVNIAETFDKHVTISPEVIGLQLAMEDWNLVMVDCNLVMMVVVLLKFVIAFGGKNLVSIPKKNAAIHFCIMAENC